MEQLPSWIPVLFILTTALTTFMFFRAGHNSKIILLIVLGWLGLQAIVTSIGIYQVTTGIPPRFALLIFPPVFFIIGLLVTKKGRSFLDGLDARTLTLLHVVRIPVELVLYGLYLHHALPKIMTFDGQNFDVLSGLTAPVIWYLYYYKGWMNKWALLGWNLICLTLLINIVFTAVLSVPLPFQRFGFEQPNIALLFFPYSWLPALVVPVVLLAHIVVIRRIFATK